MSDFANTYARFLVASTFRAASLRGLSKEAAEDCAQSFVLTVIQRRGLTNEFPLPLLHTAIHNHITDHIRAAIRLNRREVIASGLGAYDQPFLQPVANRWQECPEQRIILLSFWHLIESTSCRLLPSQMEIIRLHYQCGQSIPDIAFGLGVKTHTAEQRLLRAIRRLRGEFAAANISVNELTEYVAVFDGSCSSVPQV